MLWVFSQLRDADSCGDARELPAAFRRDRSRGKKRQLPPAPWLWLCRARTRGSRPRRRLQFAIPDALRIASLLAACRRTSRRREDVRRPPQRRDSRATPPEPFQRRRSVADAGGARNPTGPILPHVVREPALTSRWNCSAVGVYRDSSDGSATERRVHLVRSMRAAA